MNPRQIIQAMPKVELHLHLEGAFSFEFLFGLIQKSGGEATIRSIDDLRQRFVFRDFAQFIQSWFWKNSFFRHPEDFYDSTYYTLRDLAAQNVVYVEAFFSPWDFQAKGLAVQEIIEATLAGKTAAEKDFGIRCNLIADLVRDHGAVTAPQRLDDIIPYRGQIIGIGLGGSEAQYPARDFATVFQEARRQGFHLVAHAGEAAGAQSIWEAVEELHVERIGHGVRASEDPALVNYLQLYQIPLEICPTSNLKTRVVKDFASHPLHDYYRRGLLVTINSDDPSMFATTITDEFWGLSQHPGYGWEDIKRLTINAVRAAFIDEAEKSRLLGIVNQYWSQII